MDADARAQADLQRQLAAAAAATRAADATAAAAAAPTTVAVAQSDEQQVVACPDVQACAIFMMAAAQARRSDLILLAAGRIDSFDKPAQGDRKGARELNRQGLDALGARDFAGASRLFQRAAAIDPRDVEIASNLGLALVRARQPDAATDALLKAVALDPRRTSAWAPMAEAFDLLGRADVTEASLLLAWEFSANKDKSLDYFRDRAQNADRDTMKASFGKVLRLTQAGA
jgi:Flp pilus assembly protein TadD